MIRAVPEEENNGEQVQKSYLGYGFETIADPQQGCKETNTENEEECSLRSCQ